MSSELNHQKYKYEEDIVSVLDKHCERLDQKHPLERKINFLLDIRGYLKVNNIKGSYIEFGSYESEMQYCAYRILNSTGLVENYVGLDTFEGEPKLTEEEAESMPYVGEGSFASNLKEIEKFVENNIGKAGKLIQGDFRKKEVLSMCDQYTPINVAVIDCNLESSISASLDYIIKNIVPGAVLFVDDFYTNFGKGDPLIHDMINQKLQNSNYRLIDHGFYPPFAKSFILANKENF